MTNRVDTITVRTILNSQGGRSLEANLRLEDGSTGFGAAARAIIPGRRERDLTSSARLGSQKDDANIVELREYLKGRSFESQREFDALFSEGAQFAELGADIALALSLAYCRAQARACGCSLKDQMVGLSDLEPGMPHPIVNVFSGGEHGGHISYQQLMIIPQHDRIHDDVETALQVYGEIEKIVTSKGMVEGYSASSGMLTTSSDLRELFDIIANTVERLGVADHVALGTDVAAEHLEQGDGTYRVGSEILSSDELAAFHRQLLDDYNFYFYEDPFGPDDIDPWRALTEYASPATMIVGDDLFATNAKNIDPGLASGILLKMNQVGTISGTLDAAIAARKAGMRLCVSHRSKETEDTAMADLAVAVGADLIKVGGPRRGDRIAKYNQLIRLAEPDECPPV
jgi:enolase